MDDLGALTPDDITRFLDGLGDVVVLRPGPGDGSPEISWGDTFFYLSPDGVVPTSGQPFATIVTKDYPGFDESSRLDRPGTFRLNVFAGASAFTTWTGHPPRGDAEGQEGGPTAAPSDGPDPATPDTVIAHPVYGSLGWLAVVDPGPRTSAAALELLRTAHGLASARHRRRNREG